MISNTISQMNSVANEEISSNSKIISPLITDESEYNEIQLPLKRDLNNLRIENIENLAKFDNSDPLFEDINQIKLRNQQLEYEISFKGSYENEIKRRLIELENDVK